MSRLIRHLFVCVVVASLWPAPAGAQGVTTGAIAGTVVDTQARPVAGALVVAIHVPSGSTYEATTRADGRFAIPGMRVGGPYSVTVAASGAGGAVFAPATQAEITVNLGGSTDLKFEVRPVTVEETITVTATSDPVFGTSRTGAATTVSRAELETIPTTTGRLDSITRLTPQAGGGMSFAGQDNRLNNITVDGSSFNNSFGLGSTPGDRTGVAAISLAALEQVQVNIAPYDVRQGNFVGAGINSVTRSGTNRYTGAIYYQFRDGGLVGTKAKSLVFNPGTFEFSRMGGSVSGPVVKNRLFFFGNVEDEALTQPGTTFRANTGTETVEGSVTRVRTGDLTQLSGFLNSGFNYATGPYEGYSHETPARRYLLKTDYNLSNSSKISVRYTHLDSNTDVLASNSSSLGFGNRRSSTLALNFQNTNYQILENIRSGVAEWNMVFRSRFANQLIAGYTSQDESRASRGTFFPLVDVLEAGSTYTSFGFEPFTPNNELRYKTFQAQNNLTWFGDKHAITAGVSTERYRSENVFFPGAQSVYVYNSLADFYTDANGYLANPNRTTSPVTLRRFQVRWMNIPGLEKPLQPLEVWYSGAYVQDEWAVRSNLKVTAGVRVDTAMFGDTGFANSNADSLSFRDENGAAVQYSTAKLPDASLLWSPRVGINWAPNEGRTQIRGGTGVFTGRPAYVWISNQIGNTGVLTGFEQLDNTTARPFNPNPNKYKPANVTGLPAASYELALTDPDFKFPQLWRTNIAIDQRLPLGLTGTLEFLYNRDVNGVYYINANLPAANTAFSGADQRPRWTTGNRIHSHVANAVVLKNQNQGRSWNLAGTLTRALKNGLFFKAFYSYGEAKNTVDPGSIALGSWNNNQHAGNPNVPGLGYAAGSPGHRFLAVASYTREYFNFGATTMSVVWDVATLGSTSYTYSGDLNGDGGTSNDLIFIPRSTSEMNFQTFTQSGITFTAAQQAAAWEAYINQDRYLRMNRGKYVQRGAVFLPAVTRADLSISQDLFRSLRGRRHSLQARLDVANVGNLINKNWGVGQRLISNQPLSVPTTAQGGPADAQGRAQYRLRVINNQLMTRSLETTANLADVYRIQFSFRYTFN